MLSTSVTVRPGWCWNTCPTVSSSNSLPAIEPPPQDKCAIGRLGESRQPSLGGGILTRPPSPIGVTPHTPNARSGSARATTREGRAQFAEHAVGAVDACQEPPEVVARCVVQTLAGRSAPVLDEHRTVAAVGGIAGGTLHA